MIGFRFRLCLAACLVLLWPGAAAAQTGIPGGPPPLAFPETGAAGGGFTFDDSAAYGVGAIRGQLRPVRHTTLAAGIAGQIKTFPVHIGERVKTGQVLVEMVCGELDAAVAMAEARVAAASARNAVNVRLAEANNISTLEVDLGHAELAVARAERQRVAAQHKFCRIVAPFDGVVVEKQVQAFQHVAAGEPLLELVDNSELEVEVSVPSDWLPHIGKDTGFTMDIEEIGAQVHGHFVRTVGRIDPVSQTLRVIGRLDGTHERLIAGMSGRVQMDGNG